MRLSDARIVERLVHSQPDKRIVISPMINAIEQIGPSSIDVHLGTEFMVVAHSDRLNFDPLMSPDDYDEWLRHLTLVSRYSVLEKFILHPFQFALGRTLEFLSLPRDIVGRIDGRSSWARQGLVVHSTAGDIHPGTRGFVVFELMNYGPVPIVLYPGLAIAQLRFETVEDVRESYSERAISRYFGFRPNLWSGYPDDSILRAMRGLKAESLRRLRGTSASEEQDESHSEHRLFASSAAREAPETSKLAYVSEATEKQELDVWGVEFNRAFSYFQANLQDLIQEFEGKYVAIGNDEVVDSDTDWTRLAQRMFKRFGDKAMFMSLVSAEPEGPKYMGGPRNIS